MKRLLAILVTMLFVGCMETINHVQSDGAIDATPDAAGSGAMAAGMTASPRDGSLELVVIGASIVVAALPLGAIRRRRRELEEIIDAEPQFS